LKIEYSRFHLDLEYIHQNNPKTETSFSLKKILTSYKPEQYSKFKNQEIDQNQNI
jgi:hypothetical protein